MKDGFEDLPFGFLTYRVTLLGLSHGLLSVGYILDDSIRCLDKESLSLNKGISLKFYIRVRG